MDVLHEYLVASKLIRTELGDSVLVDAQLSIVRLLATKQVHFRENFLLDFESTCAAANDFYRMMESFDELMESLKEKYPHVGWESNPSTEILIREASDLLCLYGNDAVYAVQQAHVYVMRDIRQSTIPTDLFSRDWEDRYTHNEVALSLVKTVEDYLFDFYNFLANEFLYRKVVSNLIRSVVCFYVQSLLHKADQMRRFRRRNKHGFDNRMRALCRMMYDIQVLQTYFFNLAQQLPSLARVAESELSVLIVLHELLGMAAGAANVSSKEEFIVVLHKRTGGDVGVTRHLMRDVWLLGAPKSRRREIEDTLSLMNAELQMLSMRMAEFPDSKKDPLRGLRLEETLRDLYQDRILQERNSLCGVCVQGFKTISPKKPERIQEALVSLASFPLALYRSPRHTATQVSDQLTTQLIPKIIESLPGGLQTHENFVEELEKRVLGTLKLHNIAFMKHSTDLEAKVFSAMMH